jgi:GT2 family glycosyltransferase
MMSLAVGSGKSLRRFAASCFPRRIKTFLKTGPLRAAINALDLLEARLYSQGLSACKVFEPSFECSVASASMSIVVPIHDAPLVTKRCLASLERDAPQSEIILVDDGSRLAATTEVIQKFSNPNGWKVVRNEEPRGHSAACAAGTRLANRPYLCLLNSDTVITPWCWGAMQEAFEADPTIGVAGPSTSFSGGNEQTVPIAFKCRFLWTDSQICGFAERLALAPPQPVIRDLTWISGFALFIRRSLWEELGGFDQHLRDYSNEVELCTRITKLGYRNVWVQSAYVHHFGGQSYGKLMPASDIKSRNDAGLQYIRTKHSLRQPAVEQ